MCAHACIVWMYIVLDMRECVLRNKQTWFIINSVWEKWYCASVIVSRVCVVPVAFYCNSEHKNGPKCRKAYKHIGNHCEYVHPVYFSLVCTCDHAPCPQSNPLFPRPHNSRTPMDVLNNDLLLHLLKFLCNNVHDIQNTLQLRLVKKRLFMCGVRRVSRASYVLMRVCVITSVRACACAPAGDIASAADCAWMSWHETLCVTTSLMFRFPHALRVIAHRTLFGNRYSNQPSVRGCQRCMRERRGNCPGGGRPGLSISWCVLEILSACVYVWYVGGWGCVRDVCFFGD